MMDEKCKAQLTKIAREWKKWHDKTVDDMVERYTIVGRTMEIDTKARTRILRESRAERLNKLHGAVDMAEAMFNRDEVFNTLEDAIGLYALEKTNLYDMTQN